MLDDLTTELCAASVARGVSRSAAQAAGVDANARRAGTAAAARHALGVP
jgi:hypothetical protein